MRTVCDTTELEVEQSCLLAGFCGKFDEELWTALLDYATVYARDDIRFTFKAGNEVKVDG